MCNRLSSGCHTHVHIMLSPLGNCLILFLMAFNLPANKNWLYHQSIWGYTLQYMCHSSSPHTHQVCKSVRLLAEHRFASHRTFWHFKHAPNADTISEMRNSSNSKRQALLAGAWRTTTGTKRLSALLQTVPKDSQLRHLTCLRINCGLY